MTKIMMGKRENILAATHNDEGFVVFDHVQKSYDGEILVVKDLNLSIGKGEFLTLLGPSGSGKTTCLMMLAGLKLPQMAISGWMEAPLITFHRINAALAWFSKTTPCSHI